MIVSNFLSYIPKGLYFSPLSSWTIIPQKLSHHPKKENLKTLLQPPYYIRNYISTSQHSTGPCSGGAVSTITHTHRAALRRGCEHCEHFGFLHVSTITHTHLTDGYSTEFVCSTLCWSLHMFHLILWITKGILVLIFQVVWNDETLAQIRVLRGQDWKIWMI